MDIIGVIYNDDGVYDDEGELVTPPTPMVVGTSTSKARCLMVGIPTSSHLQPLTAFLLRLMQRPDPMIAAKPGASDVQAMAARTLWLEELYFLGWPRPDQPSSIWSVYRFGSQISELDFD